MQIFNLTLTQMLVMFVLILTGYILKKTNVLPKDSPAVLSKLLAFVLSPALALSNQIKMCTPENFINNSKFMLYGFGITLVAIALSYPLSALIVKNSKKDPETTYIRQIYKYALTFANWGYMGNYIVLGIWGDEMYFKYTMFTFFMSVLTNAWGIYILVPKDQNHKSLWSNLRSGLLTPPFIALILGMFLGITGLNNLIPGFVTSALGDAGACMGPMAMILAGMVIGGYKASELLSDKKIYVTTFLRLIVLPAIFVSVLKLLGTDSEIVMLALVAFATPLGLNTIVYPAAYGSDTRTGASMAMISHLLSVITIPIMYYIFTVLI